MYMFVDADLPDNRNNQRIQNGILIFMNKGPIHWYIKRQRTIEVRTFGAEFQAICTDGKMVESLFYELQMFGMPINGRVTMICDNETVYKYTVMNLY